MTRRRHCLSDQWRDNGNSERAQKWSPLVREHWRAAQDGLVMAYKRLEVHTFTWPAIKDGVMNLGHAQFEALFSGLDWRRVRALEVRAPLAVE